MKAKSSAILVAWALSWGGASVVASTTTSAATAHVRARIAPRIAVSGPTKVTVSLHDNQIGTPIHGELHFQVRANTPEVEMQVVGTDLYRAGDPSCGQRIPVAGPGVQVTYAHVCHQLPWSPLPTHLLPAGWTGSATEVGTFTASTAATFAEDVTVDVSWQTTDPTLPAGTYVGFVKLIGLVRP
jgi:hypothetical protein